MFHLDPAYIGHAWPTFMWTVLIFAAIGCFMGFFEFVWFMSVGYGFAVMCIGLFHLIFGLINGSLTIATGILSVLFIIYGWRLGGYLLRRELKNANYKKTLESTGAAKRTPIFVSAVMWIIMMFLYTAQTSAVSYRVINQSKDNVWAWIGIVIMALAIIGEATADRQKSAAKKRTRIVSATPASSRSSAARTTSPRSSSGSASRSPASAPSPANSGSSFSSRWSPSSTSCTTRPSVWSSARRRTTASTPSTRSTPTRSPSSSPSRSSTTR